MEESRFSGFGPGALRFFAELADHNDRTWFNEHKERYIEEIRSPAIGFVETLGAELTKRYPRLSYGTQLNGSGSLMRINRDIRFSPDKRPYKENLGIIFWLGEGKKVEQPCFYFHLDRSRIFFYGGQHMFPKAVLPRFREAVADPDADAALAEILANLERDGLPLMEEPTYKRTPQGYGADHPRAFYLRLSGLGVGENIDPELAGKPDLVDHCLHRAETMRPLMEWLLPLQEG